jgi:hypothetical protein
MTDAQYLDALAREIADLQAAQPGASATAKQWTAWYLRQASILDEIARVDPLRADEARQQAELVRQMAHAKSSEQDDQEKR